MEDLTGKQFGAYQIVAPLGEGGMAAVYKAYQPAMERYVALKVLPRHFAEDAQFVERFKREARLVAQLQHPHILPVFDYGQADGYTYIVMPFIQGGTLADTLNGKPQSLHRIRQIISQIGDALNYAHLHGLIHRDIKPSNVLIDEGGNCLLTDFGLARMVEASVNLTTSGAIMGTPAYMSPEQGSGQKIDARSDIYSLGVILYEMATGRVPYKAETPIAVVFKHIQDPLPPARSINPALPEVIERVILKALAKRPEDRYQTAGEMVHAIQPVIQNTPATTVPASPAETSKRPQIEVQTGTVLKQTNRAKFVRLWGVIGVLAVVIIGVLLALFGRSINSADQNPLPAATIQPAKSPTPLISPTILFQEDFEGSHVLPFTYIENGNWKVTTDETGNQVYEIDNRTSTGYPQIRFGKSSWKDYELEFRTRILDFTSSDSMVFCIIRLRSEHFDQLNFTSQYISIGTEPPFHEFGGKSISVEKGIWYSIRIEAQGEQLRVYLNNELAINTSDTHIGEGDMTIGVGPGAQAQFDDIKVIELNQTDQSPTPIIGATALPTAGGASAPTEADCSKKEVFCVGLVSDVGKVNDKSFNQSAWEGVQKSKTDGVADVVQFIETSDAKDYAKNISTFADAGYDVIVTVGFGLGEATAAAAKSYPGINFIGVDQFQAWPYTDDKADDIANLTGLNFPEDNAGFLVGALAAMMSESHVIGAVCGTDVVPPVWRFGEGYKAGAAYADRLKGITTEVQVVYHSDVGFDKTFTDPEWGAQTAKAMMDNGADAIFGCGGITGNGAITAAAQAGKYAIGVDADQYLTLPEAAPRMLSSAMKLITPGVVELIAAAKGGTIEGGNFIGDAGYAPFHNLDSKVPADVKSEMEKINAGLFDGSITTGVSPAKP